MKTFPVFVAVLLASYFGWRPAVMSATTISAGTVTLIHGPADLDLAGEFTWAINFSLNDPPLTIKGVKFQPDGTLPAGLTIGPNNVTPWQAKPGFGSDVDSDSLEQLFEDIRWADSGAGQFVETHLPVTVGQTYKIQILFYENYSNSRRWDIEVEGVQTVDEITSLGPDFPPYTNNTGVLYTYTVTAADASLDIRMGNIGGADDGGDRNPIWQGLTVEHIVPDTDSDGLPDAWETLKFGNIAAQTGAGDADSDGLSNQYEYQLGSNQSVADTDGDGLPDGAEYFTHRSNVFVSDSDGDGLSDGAEVAGGSSPARVDTDGDGLTDPQEINVYHTNPADRDTDHDGSSDLEELNYGTNPLVAASFPLYGTSTGVFTGGDAGEGLDLDGSFFAAARFSTAPIAGSGQVRDAHFVPFTSVAGLLQDLPNPIDQWVTMNFATPTANDNALTEVMRPIRFGDGVRHITIPGLTVGRPYKLQLLFAEACCGNRGFDIYVNDILIADEFAPAVLQGGPSPTPDRGEFVSYGFIAQSTSVDIRLDKTTISSPGLGDPNSIISAFTIEENYLGADTDGDLLPDSWEMRYFTNLNQTGSGDPDSDGLTNLQELAADLNPNSDDTDSDGFKDAQELNTTHTNPRLADSDRDGLNDGAEVNTYLTDPNNPDSEGDGVSDGAEVNIYHSNPLSIESDGDGFPDVTEVMNGSDPGSAASTPAGPTYVSRVFGADPGEGLDLTGTFRYAFNVGTNGAPGQIHDAVFTDDFAPGIVWSAPNEIPAFDPVFFSPSAADAALSTVFQSIRWADRGNGVPDLRTVKVDLTGLTVGQPYKLQLMFGEGCCAGRAFDVFVQGAMIVDEFNPSIVQGGVQAPRITGAAIVHTFVATDTVLHIELDGRNTTTGNDGNAILSGVTLESVTASVDLEIKSVSRTPTSFTINTRGTPGKAYSVDYSTNLTTWNEVWDSLVPNATGDGTWTDTAPARISGPRGYYKVRDPVLDPTP